jgi:hypothetical protein
MKLQHIWSTGIFVTSLTLSGAAWGDSWSHDDDSSSSSSWQPSSRAVPINKAFKNECSACHFAYPASFLPSASWVKVMNNLDQHFGENAELDEPIREEITNYLKKNASNRFMPKASRLSNANDVPLRITETSYFRREHDEIPKRMVTGNTKVGSFSNCLACHSQAERGSFRESEVKIPNYGWWD